MRNSMKKQEILNELSTYSNLSDRVLEEILKFGSIESKLNIAYNTTTPSEVLWKLANLDINDYSSENEKEIILSTKTAAIQNKNFGFENLSKMYTSSSSIERECVASNPRTPAYIFTELSKDESINVLKAIVCNVSAPISIKLKLLKNPKVCEELKKYTISEDLEKYLK